MNNQVTIAEIIGKAEKIMEERAYIAESMRIYRQYWNKFSMYTQKENIKYFNVDMANEYLKTALNYPEEISKKKRVQDHVRAIKRLVEIHLYGCIMTGRGVKNEETIEKFSGATIAYEKYCKKRNNSDLTIARGKTSIRNFYFYLVSKEIVDVNEITPKDISEFISTKLCYSKKRCVSSYEYFEVILQKYIFSRNRGQGYVTRYA